jgi:hypothetical protein
MVNFCLRGGKRQKLSGKHCRLANEWRWDIVRMYSSHDSTERSRYNKTNDLKYFDIPKIVRDVCSILCTLSRFLHLSYNFVSIHGTLERALKRRP